MAKVQVLTMSGEAAGDIDLKDEVFGIEINQNAVHAVIKNYLANRRQGTQSAKTRGEVRGGGKKPFRQKGTGRARQGSRVAPNHVGGGVVFAPKPRDYRYTLPRKLRRLAMRSALSSKLAEKEIIVLDSLHFEAPKTKDMIKVLENIGAAKKSLIVLPEKDENVIRSAHNIPGVRTVLATTMNVYEILNHTSFIVTKDAVSRIETLFSKKDRFEEVPSV
ncbi:MAG: 50S ribosomal protein L4 [Clostridiales Family XIII bacterium]|jgi:large subunit ribosomal protein L4|nr:50S ribosomal protein L4 [Clostridiales Family XIII bacterium]